MEEEREADVEELEVEEEVKKEHRLSCSPPSAEHLEEHKRSLAAMLALLLLPEDLVVDFFVGSAVSLFPFRSRYDSLASLVRFLVRWVAVVVLDRLTLTVSEPFVRSLLKEWPLFCLLPFMNGESCCCLTSSFCWDFRLYQDDLRRRLRPLDN